MAGEPYERGSGRRSHRRVYAPGPVRPVLGSLGTAIYPRHILERHVDDGTFIDTWGIDTDAAEIVGTGPFTIGSYRPGERVVMARSPNYWLTDGEGNRLPYLDSVVHIIVEDLDAELASFLAGESDVHGVLGEEYPNWSLYRTSTTSRFTVGGPASARRSSHST